MIASIDTTSLKRKPYPALIHQRRLPSLLPEAKKETKGKPREEKARAKARARPRPRRPTPLQQARSNPQQRRSLRRKQKPMRQLSRPEMKKFIT